jgi:hypothetical protein
MVHNTLVDDGPEVVQFRAGNAPRAESRDVHLVNNIVADSTGAMRRAVVQRSHGVAELEVRNNLYWNGGRAVPSGRLCDPNREPGAVRADPEWRGLPPVLTSVAEAVRGLTPRSAGARRAAALGAAVAVTDDLLGQVDDVERLPARSLRSEVRALPIPCGD